MQELLVNSRDKVYSVLKILYPLDMNFFGSLAWHIPLKQKKDIINENILKNIEGQVEKYVGKPLYRGIIVDNTSTITQEKLFKCIDEYATGSFTEDINIAKVYGTSDPNGNLYITSDDYFQVIIEFVEGCYLDMSKLINFDDESQTMYSNFYSREKEYYCFVKEFKIVMINPINFVVN